jgi:hypothetical protein
MPQQMSALLCKHLGPEPFPDIDGKLIDGRKSGNQGNAGSRAQRTEIELSSRTLIWNRFYPA